MKLAGKPPPKRLLTRSVDALNHRLYDDASHCTETIVVPMYRSMRKARAERLGAKPGCDGFGKQDRPTFRRAEAFCSLQDNDFTILMC